MVKYHNNERPKKPSPKSLGDSEKTDDSTSELTDLTDRGSDTDINAPTDIQLDEVDKEDYEDNDKDSVSDINAYLRAHVVETTKRTRTTLPRGRDALEASIARHIRSGTILCRRSKLRRLT